MSATARRRARCVLVALLVGLMLLLGVACWRVERDGASGGFGARCGPLTVGLEPWVTNGEGIWYRGAYQAHPTDHSYHWDENRMYRFAWLVVIVTWVPDAARLSPADQPAPPGTAPPAPDR